MPITSVESDPVALTLTAIGDYPVPVARLWKAWADPRQLERFWGPPQWPATFTRHDMKPGGRSEYYMAGPNGEISRGYWDVLAVRAPELFEVQDGFANDDGSANDALPGSRMQVRFESTAAGSRFVAVSTFASVQAMEQLVAMGMVEGIRAALGQMDEVLADLAAASASFLSALEVLDDTHVVVTRVVRGSLEQVWRAHHEPALVQQWMLGPDGWTMPVCEVARGIGDRYRYEWQGAAAEERFGFVGEVLEQEVPRREVSTEAMIGMDGPGTVNELTLVPQPGGRTRMELRITYPSTELRDIVIGSGMVEGMEASYARLETLLGA
jgi:uncharacterized protein YndB with AHSA1/START domain